MNLTTTTGQISEQRALDFLLGKGCVLVTKNWRWQGGEIDIIMLDAKVLVFIEVRCRKHSQWGGALASVDHSKQQKIITTAALFLQHEPRWANYPCRFDVVALQADEPIHWLKNAFDGFTH